MFVIGNYDGERKCYSMSTCSTMDNSQAKSLLDIGISREFNLLNLVGTEMVQVTDLARSPSAILSYLQALVNAGIVETYKEGKVNKYMVSGDCSKK